MDNIGKLATAVMTSVSRASLPSSVPAVPAVRYDASNLPAWHNKATDLDIPMRAWSGWIPSVGQRTIVRALHDDERRALQDRANELRPVLQAYVRPHEDDLVAAAISDMFSGFPSMRQRGGDALGRVDSAMRMLADCPAWAIERGCMSIQRDGYTVVEDGVPHIERHWPPGDPEIRIVVLAVVQPYRKALTNAEGLLAAPVEPPPAPKPTLKEIEAALGRPLAADVAPRDGNHARRVQTDIEARRHFRAEPPIGA